MITCRVSAGSASIIADMEAKMATYATVNSTNWASFSFASTAGSKYWMVWAEHYDATADELIVVYSDGCAAPDGNYEYITVAEPTLTGHTLSYPAVGAPCRAVQSSKGSSGGGNGGATVPLWHIRLGPLANITTDFMNVVNLLAPSSGASNSVLPQLMQGAFGLFYFTAATGSQEWQIWAVIQTSQASNTNYSVCIVSMDGVNAPGTGSDRKAFPLPQTAINTWNTNNPNQQIVRVGVPMRFFVGLLR